MKIRTNNKAYTLVEMALVIVIIAFITGATLAGSALIQNAKIMSTIKTIGMFDQAISKFKEKYNYLPGDFPNASTYLDSSSFNGNGNGLMEYYSFGGNIQECMNVMHHLYAANLTELRQQAIKDGNSCNMKFFSSPISQDIAFRLCFTQNVFAGLYNSIMLAYYSNCGDDLGYYAGLTVNEAMMIDIKMDDGLPSYGKIIAFDGNAVANYSCSYPTSLGTLSRNNGSGSPWPYNLTNANNVVCRVAYVGRNGTTY